MMSSKKKRNKSNRNALYLFFLLSWIMIVTSCHVLHPYERPGGVAGQGLYRDTTITDSTTIAIIPWKLFFADSSLQSLIQEGINNNYDLKIAVARIREAEANYHQAYLAFFPSITGNADATISNNAQSNVSTTGTSKSLQTYLSSGWEIDLWGKLRSARRAQLAALLQSEAYRRSVQSQLVSNIAADYYNLLAYDQQLKISLRTVENRKEDIITTQALKDADVLTGAAVMQSNANRYSVEVTIPDIKRNIRETENAICVLIGRNPGAIARDSLQNQQINADLRTGLPTQLLSNRPDVQEAEYQVRYYAELTNVARTYFYPSINITGEAGLFQSGISQFFFTLAAGLTQPIFQNGLNKQRLEVAKGQEEEYLYTFERTVLSAGQEVSNALYEYQSANEKIDTRSKQLYYLQKSVEYTKELMKYNYNTNYTDVLTSEQNYLSAQLSSIDDKLQQLQAIVSLYNSLGGGWR
ncbi:MAG TPA: TolC family protein [Chitinophagaceae bacterium]